MSPPGLLFVPGEPGPNLSDAEFNDWYDNEHVPVRMDIPTFQTTSRWLAADDKRPRHLAMYDVDACDVLTEPPYTDLPGQASERERDVMRRVQLLDRRTYDMLDPQALPPPIAGYDQRAPGPYLITLEIEIDKAEEEDLNRWYSEEHIPLLAQVPGWRRTRRFVLRGAGPAKGSDAAEMNARGPKPKYLAVHEWESPASFETQEFKHATSTPWRMRLFQSARVWEKREYRLLRAWARE